MLRGAQKKPQQNKRVAKPTRVIKARKINKRTITTKRSIPTQTKLSSTISNVPKVPTSIKFQSSTFPTFSTTLQPTTFTTIPTYQSKRTFGGHAELHTEPTYEGVQVEKYGKQKLPKLFGTDTPSFKHTFQPIDINSEVLAARPQHQKITAEEYCASMGIVLVDNKEVAHCVGNPDGPHPAEFIQIRNSTPKVPQACKYCGTRFMMKSAWDDSMIAFQPEH